MTTICKTVRVTTKVMRATPISCCSPVSCFSSSASNSSNKSNFPWMCCNCPADSCYIPSGPTMYDCRKYGHMLPANDVATPFEPLPCIPTGIFRNTEGERLGPGADKCGWYKQPEYFSFHHMSFIDMHMILRPCRQPCPMTGRKP